MANRSKAPLFLPVVIILAVIAVGIKIEMNRSTNATATTSSSTSANEKAVTSPPKKNELPLAPEKNPPGDIPDNQVFITFNSPEGGYGLKVPEGWARTIDGAGVRYTDKFDGLQVELDKTDNAPTVESVRQNQLPALEQTGRAVKVTNVAVKKMANADAIVISYESNSEPDPVTAKQIRLENECYLYYHNGRLAALTLWAPLGADNVDQWRLISNSFRWN